MEYKIYNTIPKLDLASEVEPFLATMFGYGNYSFNKALSGWDESGLQTLLAIYRQQGVLKGVAMALYDKNDPRIAIFGPIAVDRDFRSCGVGQQLAGKVLINLEKVGMQAVYLGVREGHPARNLYKKLGFQNYSGVVMCKMFVAANRFEQEYFKVSRKVQVRKISWADYPKFQALYSYPCQMKTFDLQSAYLSSKYTPISKFLGVFPAMMNISEKGKADIRVLTAGKKEAIVGIAKYQNSQNPDLKEVNVNFILHDNFLDHSDILLKSIIKNAILSNKSVYSECIASDDVSIDILEKNQFHLNSEATQEISGYGREMVYKYKYLQGK